MLRDQHFVSFLQVGLLKLEFTEGQVTVMRHELEALKPTLIQTVAETEQLMAQVCKYSLEASLLSSLLADCPCA